MRKHWFKFVLLGLTLVCGIGIWVALDCLWDVMAEYEASSEIGAVSAYFDRFASGDYDTAADTSGFPFDEKSPREDYIRYLKNTFGSEFSSFRFAGRNGETQGEKIYGIYADSEFLGEVRLIPSESGERRWNVVAVVEYAEPLTVIAPSYATVSVNGKPATPSPDAEPVADEDFLPLAYLIPVPTKVTYHFDGYLFSPQVTAIAPDGTVCVSAQQEDGTVMFSVPLAEGQTEEIPALLSDFATTYAAWIAKDASFSRLQPMLDRSTTFYKDLLEFVNYWFTDHDGYEFRNIQVSDFSRPADGLMAGTVSFEHVVFYKGEELVYETSYRLSYRQVNGAWLMSHLEIL